MENTRRHVAGMCSCNKIVCYVRTKGAHNRGVVMYPHEIMWAAHEAATGPLVYVRRAQALGARLRYPPWLRYILTFVTEQQSIVIITIGYCSETILGM